MDIPEWVLNLWPAIIPTGYIVFDKWSKRNDKYAHQQLRMDEDRERFANDLCLQQTLIDNLQNDNAVLRGDKIQCESKYRQLETDIKVAEAKFEAYKACHQILP